jgi:hypothetical protein
VTQRDGGVEREADRSTKVTQTRDKGRQKQMADSGQKHRNDSE